MQSRQRDQSPCLKLCLRIAVEDAIHPFVELRVEQSTIFRRDVMEENIIKQGLLHVFGTFIKRGESWLMENT